MCKSHERLVLVYLIVATVSLSKRSFFDQHDVIYQEHMSRWSVLLRGCNIVLLCTHLPCQTIRSIALSAACVRSTYHTPNKEIVMGRCWTRECMPIYSCAPAYTNHSIRWKLFVHAYTLYYASRRSHTRYTVNLTVCLCICSLTVTMRRKLTASIGF